MQFNSSMQILLTVVRSLILPTLVFPVSLLEARNFLDRFPKNIYQISWKRFLWEPSCLSQNCEKRLACERV